MQALDHAREQIARAEAGSGQKWWRAFVLTDLRDLVAELEHRGEAMATMAAYIDTHWKEKT
jgi:hypothetical protein